MLVDDVVDEPLACVQSAGIDPTGARSYRWLLELFRHPSSGVVDLRVGEVCRSVAFPIVIFDLQARLVDIYGRLIQRVAAVRGRLLLLLNLLAVLLNLEHAKVVLHYLRCLV